MSKLEEDMALQFRCSKLKPAREFRFAAHHVGEGKGLRARLNDADLRDWRFDFAFLDEKIAVEIEGGSWVGGAHTRGKHFQSDCDKYNRAQKLGWKVLRFTGAHVKNGSALSFVESVLNRND